MASEHRVAYLDGVRALAIVSVILFHWAGFFGSVFPGGYVGVDLFFVLSGFIITRILWSRGDQLSYFGFLAARVKRLYPALVGVVVVASALVVLLGVGWKRTALAAFLALSQLNSFAIPAGVTFFQPFGVTWSLSGEWVSYLVLPLALIVLRRRPLRAAAFALAGIAIVMYLAALLLPGTWFYFGPLSRAAQIFAGGAVALASVGMMTSSRSRLAFGIASGLGAAVIIAWGILGFGPFSTTYEWLGFPLLTIAGLTLIIGGLFAPRSPVARVLALPPVALLGRVSYSLYLWHVVGFEVFGPFSASLSMPVYGLICAAFVAATTTLSYLFLERPFMKARSSVLSPQVAAAATDAKIVGILPQHRELDQS